MNPLRWLLKKLGIIKEKKAVEKADLMTFKEAMENLRRIASEVKTTEPVNKVMVLPRRPARYKVVRGRFKPKTAFEKKLWKPDEKPED